MIYDIAIFGGGIVGANIFNKVVRCGKSAILIELNDIASGESKANSAIIHAGFDAKPNTLKAKFNVLGSKLYPHICDRLNVPYKKIGAYVLGNDKDAINELYKRGIKNGLDKTSLEILDKNSLNQKIKNLNPNINYGLFAKNSAIVNPYLLTIALAEEGVINGGQYRTFFRSEKINFDGEIFEIFGNGEIIKTKNIVNASGFGYNDISRLLGTETYNIEFRRGEYYVLDNTEHALVSSTMFPLPSKHSKGILITPTVDDNILVGPTAENSENITKTTTTGLNSIKQKSISILNNVNLKKVIRVFSGIRTIVGEDFIVEKSKINSKVINIAGICSPGLSSAPAIAIEVLSLLDIDNIEIKNEKIAPYKLAKDMGTKEFNELVKKDKSFGHIVCKCEMITEGDIISALHRPIAVKTVDGIKRRVRAGMGRCQGGFCTMKVAKIIARENNISIDDVLKEYPNSNIVVGNINSPNLP